MNIRSWEFRSRNNLDWFIDQKKCSCIKKHALQKKPYIQKANQEIFLVIFCFSSWMKLSQALTLDILILFLSPLWPHCKSFWRTRNRQRNRWCLKENWNCNFNAVRCNKMKSFTCQQEESKDDNWSVSKIQKSWSGPINVQLGHEVMDTVDK